MWKSGHFKCLLIQIIIASAAVLPAGTALALRCVSCQLNDRADCARGAEAALVSGLQLECPPSHSYCQVIVQEWLMPVVLRVRDVERGCAETPQLTCFNLTTLPVRLCTATCRDHLCNVADDVAALVAEARPEQRARPAELADGAAGDRAALGRVEHDASPDRGMYAMGVVRPPKQESHQHVGETPSAGPQGRMAATEASGGAAPRQLALAGLPAVLLAQRLAWQWWRV